MRLASFLPLVILLSGHSPAAAQATAPAPDASPRIRFEQSAPPVTDAAAARMVDLFHQARGGSPRSYILSGKVREGLQEYRVTHYFEAPAKYRKEIHRESLGWRYLTVYATDGAVAWKQDVLPDVKPATTLEADEMAQVNPAQALYDLLDQSDAKGIHLRYGGEARSAGEIAFIVRAEGGEGTIYYYFDKQLFLPRSVGYVEQFAGRPVHVDHFPLRWQLVDGIRMETAYEVRSNGQLLRRIEYDRVEVNVDVPDDLFLMPRYREVWLRQLGRGESGLEHRPELPPDEADATQK